MPFNKVRRGLQVWLAAAGVLAGSALGFAATAHGDAASVAGVVVDDAGNGIPGVELKLYEAEVLSATVGGNAQPEPATAYTDQDGGYLFDGLAPGFYTILEVQPEGYGDGPDIAGTAGGSPDGDDSIVDIELVSGEEATGYEFGELTGALRGLVFQDHNDDGTFDTGEERIPDVVLTLTGTDVDGNPVMLTTITESDGVYEFTGLVAGRYTVHETQPSGYANGKEVTGTAGGIVAAPNTVTEIDLEAAEHASYYLFAEIAGVLNGIVFVDSNGDGDTDVGENGRLGGVTVVLEDDLGNEIDSTTTDGDGAYLFAGVTGGEYTVRETQPGGYGSTSPNAVGLEIEPGDGATVTFGEELGSIGDFVWSDDNRNGLQDAGEAGVGGVEVNLLLDGVPVDTTSTDGDGRYRFTGVEVGTYQVSFVAPQDMTFTSEGKPDAARNSDPNRATGRTGGVEIMIDGDEITHLSDVDAGLVDRIVDLAAALTVDNELPAVGEPVVFTGVLTNVGTLPVTGAMAVITIPEGLTIVSAGGPGWDCEIDGQVATCATDLVLQPEEATPPITVETRATYAFRTTTASIRVTLADGSADDNESNDQALVSLRVEQDEPAQQGAVSDLVSTGSPILPQAVVGLVAMLLGIGAVTFARRRRRDTR